MTRVAVVQFEPHIADSGRNLDVIEDYVAQSAAAGAQLVVFPECAVSGYVYQSLAEAMENAETIPGPAADRLGVMASRHGVYLVAGLLERVEDRCYNAALLVSPTGPVAVYRKSHVLCLGVDRFTTPGDTPYVVHDLPIGRLGILICYDLRFPEPARLLALAGAQVIALPTNWPRSSHIQPEVFSRARAAENRIFVLAADRVGDERGATFLGRSQIVGPDGVVVQEASIDGSEILIQDIDVAAADEKHVVLRAGDHEMDCFADRRTDLYELADRSRHPAEAR